MMSCNGTPKYGGAVSAFDESGPPVRPALGQPAPPIELVTADGTPWRLSDHLGSTVVLIFHRHIH